MYLNATNLVYYLLARGHVSHRGVVDGDFCVVPIVQRNRNFKVIRQRETGLFVKQVRAQEQNLIETLRREALCYETVQSRDEYAPLARLMPRLIDYDPHRNVLVLELLPDAENLLYLHQRLNDFPPDIGRLMGIQLGTYHSTIGQQIGRQSEHDFFPRPPPWILSLHHHSEEMIRAHSGANAQLIDILHEFPEFERMIDELREQWRYDSLIHGDIKFANCLVLNKQDGSRDFRLVDWELTDYGDADWDVGGMFQAYLDFWIESMPFQSEAEPARFASRAMYKIEAMQPAIRAFWEAYVETRGFARSEVRGRLLRCIRYGAARMVQTAFETSNQSPQIGRNAVTMLQVSLNILKNPANAAGDLFGC